MARPGIHASGFLSSPTRARSCVAALRALDETGALGVVSKVDRHWFLQVGTAIFFGVLDGLAGAAHLKPSIDLLTFLNGTQDQFDSRGKVPFDFKSDEQRQVVLDTLANRDQVYAIRGRAEAGTTTSLQEIRKGLEKAATAVGQPSAKPPEELSLPSFPANAGWCSTTGFASPKYPRTLQNSSSLVPAAWSFCGELPV